LKDAKDLVKSQVGTATDRRKAEVLRSSGINHTGRGLEYGFISHSRGASCQTMYTLDISSINFLTIPSIEA